MSVRAVGRVSVLLSALVACVEAPATKTHYSALTGIGSCFDPVSYGAVPWTSESSPPDAAPGIRAAIDAATAAGGTLCPLGKGTWFVTRAPATYYNGKAAISWHAPGIWLVGAGRDDTVIMASGDAGAATFNIISMDPGASDGGVRSLTIDTTGLFNTDLNEQTHAVQIGSGICAGVLCQTPVTNITVENVRFLHDGLPGERWGDCIRVAGNTVATQVRNVKLLGLDLLRCGRSGIATQRNANHIVVAHSYFDGDGIDGGMFDGEATGGEGSTGLRIHDNTFRRTIAGGDNFAIAMTSQDAFSVHDNEIYGRGVTCVRCTNGSIHHNLIDATDFVATLSVIDLANRQERVSVDYNKIRRRGGNGPCIKAAPHAGVFPGPLDISHNQCTNETDAPAIFLDSVSDGDVSHNTLVGSGGPSTTGVYVQGSRVMDNLVLTGNKCRGMTFACLRLVSSAIGTYTGVAVGLNTSRPSTAGVPAGPGLRCDNAHLMPPGGVTVTPSNWSNPSTCTPP